MLTGELSRTSGGQLILSVKQQERTPPFDGKARKTTDTDAASCGV